MEILQLRQKLIEICLKCGAYKGSTDVVVDIPYIPYIPDNWNGVLVVAESQNLNIGAYADCSVERKICRLYPDYDNTQSYAVDGPFPILDVKPWEDGSIPLALKAAFNLDPYKTAVCNACFWSRREGNANANPNKEMQDQSRELWKEMWGALEPHIEFVVTCGTIAASVFDFVGGKRKKLRSPSPNAMSRVSGMFRKDDLLERYPEVKTAYEEMKFDENDISYEQNKIFYACHVVSLLKVRLSR